MSSQNKDAFEYALRSNQAWADYKSHQHPKFFEKLAAGQSPSILWLGCSDSRVPETTLLGLSPGDVFVHRNIANIITPTDLNCMAVIEYAVVHLKVNHIVLCGHTHCGGAGAAIGGKQVGGVIDAWITPLRNVLRTNQKEFDAIQDEDLKAVRLAELNVEMGVGNLMSTFVVEQAIRERGLRVHGVLFDISVGRVRDLKVGSSAGKKVGGKGGDGIEDEEEGDIVKGNYGTLVFGGDGASMEIR